MKNRNLAIDTLRGLACILLVAYHVIGSTPLNGLKIDSGVYRDINDILAYLRMPLFTFLSGLVYAYHPFSTDSISFLTKKARRLLLPMLTVGTLFAILQSLTPGANGVIDNWYLLHIRPVGHFWFIESLFILFVFIVVVEKCQLFDSLPRYLAVFGSSVVLYLMPIYTNWFSFAGFIYLLPYFLAGMAMQRYRIFRNINRSASYLLLSLVIAVFIFLHADIIPMYDKRTLFGLVFGVVCCLSLKYLKLESSWFAKIGFYSYSIYLFHVFFTAATRILLAKSNVSQVEVVFLSSLTLGLVGPIVAEYVISRSNILGFLLLGRSRKKMAKKIESYS